MGGALSEPFHSDLSMSQHVLPPPSNNDLKFSREKSEINIILVSVLDVLVVTSAEAVSLLYQQSKQQTRYQLLELNIIICVSHHESFTIER